jgi:hypothetical protein
VGLEVVHRVPDGLELVGIFVRDIDAEFLFEGHDQLDDVEGVGTEILDELGLGSQLLGLDFQFLRDDLLDPILLNDATNVTSLLRLMMPSLPTSPCRRRRSIPGP